MEDNTVTLLMQAVAQSAYFLPQYDLRRADAAVKALRQRLVDAGPAAAPQRRPFGFSKAVKRTSALHAGDGSQDAQSTTLASADEQLHSSSVADGDAASTAGHDRQNGACSALGDGPRLHDAAEGRCGCCAGACAHIQKPTGRNSLTACAACHRRCLRGLAGQEVVLRGDSLGDGDFTLADLTTCSVWLLGRLSALRVERLTRCRVYGGPICGATFIEGAVCIALCLLIPHLLALHAAHIRFMST